jgi:hypothetical protein
VRPFDLALAERVDRSPNLPSAITASSIRAWIVRSKRDGRGELGGDLAHRQIASRASPGRGAAASART